MMELDLWNEDFQLAKEWGLDIPVAVSDGQFGDPKSASHLAGDFLSTQFQDSSQTSLNNEDDVLGVEWMESTDVGSFLETLGIAQSLPFEDSLIELAPGPFSQTSAVEVADYSIQGQSEASPELQVTSGLTPEVCGTSDNNAIISGDLIVKELNVEDFTFTDLDIISFDESTAGSVSEVEIVGSPVSVAEVESTISFSGPSSPVASTVITSSPELYKVICSASPESKGISELLDNKLSVFAKKTSKVSKSSKRKPAQPVPEYIIQGKVDKKDRKKLQNKNAAIRYRMKKKEEAESIIGEEQELETVNSQLKTKVEDLEREIRYMKNLMGDIMKAKGISI